MSRRAAILAVNAGSSSLKFQIFDIGSGEPRRRIRGQMDGIGVSPHLTVRRADGGVLVDRAFDPSEVAGLPDAIATIEAWLKTLDDVHLVGIGHRVVHGGPHHDRPVRIDGKVLEELRVYQDLAPLHQPNNLAPIRLAMDLVPDIPQIACFDTEFHRHRERSRDCYALPLELYEEGVRRYGFHGLSYAWIAEAMKTSLPDLARGRVIVAHLGSGASMCALHGGRSVESTMGFSAIDGLVMGTRSGQLDPGVLLYLMQHRGMSADEISSLLYHDSGLLGLSGISSDMRVLEASDDPRAALAIDHFVYRAVLNAGMLVAALGGLDGFVFTAGIGEHSPVIRARIVEGLAWAGLRLDPDANDAGHGRITTDDSPVAAFVIPTDEEMVIARAVMSLVGA
ncbi:MAG: acetate/propionate family kinase [Geminicoccaceae bacterium]|nr:acetate/propionate family kinase [Geminicoccaceae bacterium]